MWTLLLKFWKPIAGAVLILALLWAVHHRGYISGQADEKAVWLPQLIAAEKAKAEADARTAAIEQASKAASNAQEARIADELKIRDERAADYQRRYSALLVRFKAINTRSREVPALSGSTPEPSGTTGIIERIERTAGSVADTGRRCERDAERLRQWIAWYQEQSALMQ